MFEVGFSELLMVGLVALLVIGPEKLPKAARIAGFWLGKTRGMIASVKADIKQELHAEEIRQLLKQQIVNDEARQAVNESEAAIKDVNEVIETAFSEKKIDRQDDRPT